MTRRPGQRAPTRWRPAAWCGPPAAWAIDGWGEVEVLLSADGERVRPRTGTPRWDLGWWLNDDTVVTVAIDGPGSGVEIGPDDAVTLTTCEVPTGQCSIVDGSEGVLLRFPVDTSPTDVVDLRGGEAP